MDYVYQNGELYHARSHKYIKRERINGKWRYFYKEDIERLNKIDAHLQEQQNKSKELALSTSAYKKAEGQAKQYYQENAKKKDLSEKKYSLVSDNYNSYKKIYDLKQKSLNPNDFRNWLKSNEGKRAVKHINANNPDNRSRIASEVNKYDQAKNKNSDDIIRYQNAIKSNEAMQIALKRNMAALYQERDRVKNQKRNIFKRAKNWVDSLFNKK